MIRVFYHKDNYIEKTENLSLITAELKKLILWVDLQFPTTEDQKFVETFFSINFNTQQEEADLESNSRFYESENFIYISSNFTRRREHYHEDCPVIFYLINGLLITKRDFDLPSFAETVNKIKRNQKAFKTGDEILEAILETKIDLDSD